MVPVLYVGNRNYSSWSLRPWLALTWAGYPFETRMIPLGGLGYGKSRVPEIVAVSPSGRVPVLVVDGRAVWDSLAICELAAEVDPSLWPDHRVERAVARSAVAEMHSGFAALRRDLSMNLRRRTTARAWPDDTATDIARVIASWTELRAHHRADGPWLCGRRGIVDAFYAPVATRFRTYGVTLPPAAAAWTDTLFADAAFRAWEAEAIAEPQTIASTDALWPDPPAGS